MNEGDSRPVAGPARAGAAVAALALLSCAPSPGAALESLRFSGAATDPLAPLVSLVAIAAWALLGWLLLVAATSLVGRAPGRLGGAGRRVGRRVAPAAVRRLVELTLGLSIGAGLLGVAPAQAGAVSPPPAPPAASLDWPTVSFPASSAAPHREAPLAALGGHAPRLRNRAGEDLVVVRPGDSLWAIAADHLPAGASAARIAQAWPQWWSANRAAVGADPDLIHPGLSLTPPAHH